MKMWSFHMEQIASRFQMNPNSYPASSTSKYLNSDSVCLVEKST